ncbi:hypothetical protein VX037_05455 [Gordonia sp. Z-3]|uniref:Uncharacterized protein n=1 Tax=Gordonia tangerina TaxID=2911060 RepID=A0ABS9DIZ7_9ACTN|nr:MULTISPECIES: hypothetical protein [Gordonia]MCF3939192.1 hypothetical protein [Gordonia tangerina]MED5800471.1 hypothetical protein [Gordonia sp. Z-3]
MTSSSGAGSVPRRRGASLVRAFVNSPLSGLAPWIVMALFSGPGRFEESVSAALGLALLVIFASWRLGNSIKLLEWFDAVFFGVMCVIGLIASSSVIDWLELWGGELVNIALVTFALFSVVIRRPFTIEYAKEQTPEEFWDSPIFVRTNYVITWAWVAAFGVSAIAGLIGDAVLDTSDNFWTGWIIQIGATVFAIAFTEFYPDYGPPKAMAEMGLATEPPVSVARLFDWLPVFVLIVGIAGLVTDSISSVLGWILIVVGAVGIKLMRVFFPDEPKPGAGETDASAGGVSAQQ